MIKRILQKECISLASQYPVVTITGPRQSGKTTLARTCFPKKPYVNLEEPDQREIAIEDPRGFLKQFPKGAILDEIQRAPDIPSYIQSIVDSTKTNGMFILTGSQQFEITQSINQSLAGRTAIMKLLPFSLKELRKIKAEQNLDSVLLNGFYPRLHDQKLPPYQFHMNYFETYIQRDIRQLSQIDNLHLFEKFVRLLSTRVGQLLNYSNLANDIGLSHTTIRNWISLLEASYIIFLLPPFYQNIGKRLIKTPKVYFYDTGLASFLLGIENIDHQKHHPLRGSLFENFIVIEHLKQRFNQGKSSNLFFFRDRSGHEVDLILTESNNLECIEIKSAETFNSAFTKDLIFFQSFFPKIVKKSKVIFAGDSSTQYKGISCQPWQKL